ncbi:MULTISPECIES: ATP-binding cassette domain-containing protein [unclassified Kocuria]|uniref:ATP-binding cassette domain-containing protein n=1 Tax=unclassified Kocuria TaxID=2649579 RepID=UPI0028834D09|nr:MULTISPECIES: ATP-binding cassette domain-containing protein [unclassified Kocuria]
MTARTHGADRAVRGGASVLARGFGWQPEGRDVPALEQVDLEIPAGQRVLLLGASGSGKSTLLHALAGVLPDTEDDAPSDAPGPGPDGGRAAPSEGSGPRGELLVDGQPAAQRGVVTGLLQQDPESSILLARAGDDVAFGPENLAVPAEEIWDRADAALRAVGLEISRSRDTSALSGGQQQRLGLAGITAVRPRLLLLDEPTANLDPEGVATVRRAVETVVEDTGATLIVVEHRTEVWADLVERVVVLGPRGVLADGSPEDVLGARGAQREQLRRAGIWLPGQRAAADAPAPAPGELLLRADGLEVSREQPSQRLLSRRRRRVRRGDAVPDGAWAGAPAAQPVDLRLRAASALALTGPNGAGKSTLALTLAGLLVPSAGAVRAAGSLAGRLPNDPSVWSGPELVERIGTVFQEPEHQFLTGSVREELAVGPRRAGVPEDEIARRVDGLLERLHLSAHAEANPFTLSGGQKRRLSVGTVMAAAPQILILDEPTFGQDAVTWAAVVELLAEQVRQGRCVVVVTHDDDLVRALGAEEIAVGPRTRPTEEARPTSAPARHRGALARRDALAKLGAVAVLSLALLLSADPVTSGLILAVELVGLAALGQRPGTLLLRIWPLLVAALLSGWGTAVLSDAGGHLWVSAGPLQLTTGSIAAGAAIALRGLALALPGVMLLLSTDPTDLADRLARTMRLPVRVVLAALVGLRLVTVMIDQWQVLVTARRARGVGGSRAPLAAVRELGGRAFGLLVQSLRRASRLAVTMEVRGFGAVVDAGSRTWARPLRFGRADALLLGAAVAAAGAAPAVSQLLGAHRFIWQ